ncbi:hypothetical protein ACH5RR_001221 [Cinchona calisaya]|uniref:Ku domain-containing protein n=1 Tax=Cinchona calisaya TaxID=153742 RepID=A0ABD3B2T9_9GENT
MRKNTFVVGARGTEEKGESVLIKCLQQINVPLMKSRLTMNIEVLKEPSRVVPPEQRIKGFQYGPQVVPISSVQLETVKFKPDKSVKLLGLTNASNIMR